MTEFCLRTIAIAILLALHPILGENVSQNHSQLHTSFDDVALSEHGAVVALNRTAKNVPSTKQPEHQFEYHSGIDHHLGSDSVNLTNVLRLENVLEVFNIRDVAKLWEQHATDQFTTECANDMHAYLHGLQQRQLWATKSKSRISINMFCASVTRTPIGCVSVELVSPMHWAKAKKGEKQGDRQTHECGVN